jgi:hypothetical protein
MIRCPQCGYENALGHIFCVRCRSKLDLRVLDNKAGSGLKFKPRSGRGRRLVLSALFAGIAFSVVLALWPAPLEGRKGTVADAQQARRKILLLEKGLNPASQLFDEREINAYLDFLLREAHPAQRPGQTSSSRIPGARTSMLPAVAAVIRPNAVTISTVSVWGPVTVGSLKLGPWRVTSRVMMVPERSPRGLAPHSARFRWTIKKGWIGHLPLPGPMSVPATVLLRPLLAASSRERALLANVTHLELEEGQVAVTVKNRAWPSP